MRSTIGFVILCGLYSCCAASIPDSVIAVLDRAVADDGILGWCNSQVVAPNASTGKTDTFEIVVVVAYMVEPSQMWASTVCNVSKAAKLLWEAGGFAVFKYMSKTEGDWVCIGLLTAPGDTMKIWNAVFRFVYDDKVVESIEYVTSESLLSPDILYADDVLVIPSRYVQQTQRTHSSMIFVRMPLGSLAQVPGRVHNVQRRFELPRRVEILNGERE